LLIYSFWLFCGRWGT